MRRSILSVMALMAGVLTSSATVTVQGWWHLDNSQPITDSSGNSRSFSSAYSTAPALSGNVAALLVNNGVGGPLGSSGWTSAQSIQVGVGVGGKRQSSMWGINYNPPAQNYGIEIWVMPQDTGVAGGSGGWILSSGQSGGVALRINGSSGGPCYIDAFILGTSVTIGAQAPIDTNHWMHLALVNDNGITTFYTNGVPCGLSDTNHATASAGDAYCISAPGDNQAFYGYMDEARMFTFASGAFSINDLLLRPAGPVIVVPPQNATVWDGGAATFSVTTAFGTASSYQWRRAGTNLPSATNAQLFLSTVSTADSGSEFACVVTGGSLSITSAVARLTVVAPNQANIDAYRNAILAESSLVGYFPVDGCTGATLTNRVNSALNGTLESSATYESRTNIAFGQRALSFDVNGDVSIPTSSAYEFASGNGTVEALIYQSRSTLDNQTIFAVGMDALNVCYLIQANANGSSLIYYNGVETLSWAVNPILIGRVAHVAFVFSNTTNVTAYLNGVSLGSQQQTGFGSMLGAGEWIGGPGGTTPGQWAGAIDELAVYGSALSAAAIQGHYTKYVYGTNNAPPAIVSQSTGPKTLLAGGSPIMSIKVSGALPFSYQWTSNGVAIPGATASSLTLPNSQPSYSATYGVTVTNVFGSTNSQPIALTFVTPSGGYAGAVMSAGPMGYWRLNDTGSIAADSAGFNDAPFNGTLTKGAAGVLSTDTAVNFSNGYAEAPYSSGLNNPGPFSVEFWAKPSDTGLGVPVASQYRTGSRAGYCFYQNNGASAWVADLGIVGNTGVNRFTGTTVPTPGVWSHVVFTYDGTTASLWVNGKVEDSGAIAYGSDFMANPSAAFDIAMRNDGGFPYNGVIDEVAVYSKALTETQITNHWSYVWTPAAVVTQPQGVTNVEWSTITLSAVVSGVPNTYQWFKDNVALTPTLNYDGSAHYSQDVTNPSLVIVKAKPSDSGQYKLVVSNPVGGTATTPVKVLITADGTAPTVVAATALGTPNQAGPSPYLVKVQFSKPIDSTVTGIAVGNYVFNPSVTINTIQISADFTTAYLVTAGLTAGQKYSLTVSGVKDLAESPNTMAASVNSVRTPVLTTGGLNWDYYYLGGSVSGVAMLLGSPLYPNAPTTNMFLTSFSTYPVTGGDLDNNPAFGSVLGNNYGDVVSGWLTPTTSGDYTFFLASDDASQLFLSPDAEPGNAALIAEETDWDSSFAEPGAARTSAPQTLVAGKRYFIRAIHVEGGGNDFVSVAWRKDGDTTAATNLVPIASSFLSAYAAVPAPKFNPPTYSNGQVTISWTGGGTLFESADLKTWTAVPGNPTSPYTVVVTSAPRKFYRVVQQ